MVRKIIAGTICVLTAALATAEAAFKVVGYMPSYRGTSFGAVQFNKVTHVVWSFAYPLADGTLGNIDAAALGKFAAAAHAAGTKVFVAVGGGGNGDKGWDVCTANEDCRQKLAASCMALVQGQGLDGIDFDWEYPDGSQVAGFNATVKLLAAALHAQGKEISSAVTYNDWPRSFPTNELFGQFDFLNIMVYDNPPPHATMAHATTAMNVWVTQKGLPREKAVLGCPFYATNPIAVYRDIVAADPAAAQVDRNGEEGYNSIPTIRKKTELAFERGGGMMYWELSMDAAGPLSLVSAVHEVVLQHGGTAVRPLLDAPVHSAYRAWPESGPVLFLRDGSLEAWDPAGRMRLPSRPALRRIP